jgi:hypothetical protein
MQDRFGFPTETKIILWLGLVSPSDGALELARDAQNWPDDYRMVFHFHTERMNPHMQEIMAYHGKGQTYVSCKPIPYQKVDDLVFSASIGLGFYADKGVNARYIGASSGKVNLLLKAGIPCIVRNFEGLRWVEEYGAGLCIENTSEVFSAVEKIMGEYPVYQQRAIDTFEQQLSFDRAFHAIAEELENVLMKNPA